MALIKKYRGTSIVRNSTGFAFNFNGQTYVSGSIKQAQEWIDALRLERTLQLMERS